MLAHIKMWCIELHKIPSICFEEHFLGYVNFYASSSDLAISLVLFLPVFCFLFFDSSDITISLVI